MLAYSWSLHPCREYQSPLFTWMEKLLFSERISPFLHSCCEGMILLFNVHNLYLDATLVLNRCLLLKNNGECIKTLPCSLQRNDHGHEFVLNWIKDDMIGLLFILLEVDSPFIGGRILYHCGYITIKVMLFKNIQHPFLPCVEVGSTFKLVFQLDGDWCHGSNFFSILQDLHRLNSFLHKQSCCTPYALIPC